MNIKKLKEEIHKESYKSDPRSLIDVIDVDTLIDIIEELQAKDNEALDIVSKPLQDNLIVFDLGSNVSKEKVDSLQGLTMFNINNDLEELYKVDLIKRG